MRFLDKIRYMRAFEQARKNVAEAHPEYSQEEILGEALEQMKAKYGADPNWAEIFKLIMEFVMKILPFFFLAEPTEQP